MSLRVEVQEVMLFFYCTLFSFMHLKSCLRIGGILEIQKLEFLFFTTIVYIHIKIIYNIYLHISWKGWTYRISALCERQVMFWCNRKEGMSCLHGMAGPVWKRDITTVWLFHHSCFAHLLPLLWPMWANSLWGAHVRLYLHVCLWLTIQLSKATVAQSYKKTKRRLGWTDLREILSAKLIKLILPTGPSSSSWYSF